MKPKPSLAGGILLLGDNLESMDTELFFDIVEPCTPIKKKVSEQIPTPTWLFRGDTVIGEKAIRAYYNRHVLPAFAGMY